MKKPSKPKVVTVSPKQRELDPAQLAAVVGGNGRNQTHTVAP